MGRMEKRLSSAQMIILGFALVIVLGAAALTLPLSSRAGNWTPFLDCLFTATSAVCVTGLVVLDTASYWSGFGQGLIIALIQIGGMGVVTVAAAIALAAGKKLSLWQRGAMRDAVSAPQIGGIAGYTGFIVRGIVVFELLGALAMTPVFARDYGLWKGVWMGLFHSISAFCNAGFDIVDDGVAFNSLMGYADDPVVNSTIMALIVIGGLGFLTWRDVALNGLRWRRYRMQSKVILTVTAGLIVVPTVYFYFFELAGLPAGERFWGAWFQAVTPRTAGYNTVDLTAMSETGQMLTSLLMIIGGAPGSTAGGMKVTTFAVMLACAAATFRRRQNGRFFGRRVDDETVKNAATVFLMYIALFLAGGMAISKIEDLPLVACLYESASAVGTVGLTLGITPELGAASKLILIAQMYIGRVGGLTLLFATLPATKNTLSRLPLEKLSIG